MPRVGAGREALAKRPRAKTERRTTAEAARRALRRSTKGQRPTGPNPIRGAAAKLRAFGGLFEQRFLDRKRLRHIALALAAIWALWTFLLGDAGLPRFWSIRRTNDDLTQQIQTMTVEERALSKRVVALRDPANLQVLEEVARDEHALVREGEVLVRFTEDEE
jgi:cell division protein FtsB